MVFISRKKLLIYSRYSNFCPQCFGHVVHQLDKNSRQDMKNIFVGKSNAKCGGETSPRSFSENQNLTYPWINSLKFYAVF